MKKQKRVDDSANVWSYFLVAFPVLVVAKKWELKSHTKLKPLSKCWFVTFLIENYTVTQTPTAPGDFLGEGRSVTERWVPAEDPAAPPTSW